MNKYLTLKTYFNILRLSYVVSALMILSLFKDGFAWFLVGAAVTGLSFLGLQFFVAGKAYEMIKEKKYIGLIIALILNTILLPSMFFIVSLGGYYILVKQETQELFPKEKNPEWLNDFFDWLNNVVKDLRKTA
ncbi:MAG: hypothetical protein ACJ76H_13590 [Bacteriovoracaceae bacterium]